MQNAAQLTGTDKDLAAVAQAMAATLPKATPSKAAKAANPAKGATPTGAAAAKRAAKAPSKAVTVEPPAAEQPAKPKRAGKPKAEKVAEAVPALPVPMPKAPAAPAVAVGVYQDANRHTCIVCSVGRKLVNYVPMAGAGLAVVKMSIDKFAHDWSLVASYPVDKAAAQYLAGTIAKTPQAEEVLRTLAGQAVGKPLAKGELKPVMSAGDEADAAPVQPRSAAPSKNKAKAEGTAAPRAGKAWPNAGRKLAVGAAKVADKVREGTFRRALMDHVVAVAKKGGTTDDCLGKEVTPGKPACAKVDVDFALANGYVKFA